MQDWAQLEKILPGLRRLSLEIRTAEATDVFNRQFVPINARLRADIAEAVAYNEKQAQRAQTQTMWLTRLGHIVALVSAALLAASAVTVGRVSKRRVLQPLAALSTSADAMSAGDLDSAIAGVELNDELGTLARGFDAFRLVSLDRAREQRAQAAVVETLTAGLGKLAEGDLTFRIERAFDPQYEPLRHTFNRAVDGLGASLARVALTAADVHDGANSIRAAAEDLASRNERQAASLEETNGAVQKVAVMVNEAARDLGTMRRSIDEVRTTAGEGAAVA